MTAIKTRRKTVLHLVMHFTIYKIPIKLFIRRLRKFSKKTNGGQENNDGIPDVSPITFFARSNMVVHILLYIIKEPLQNSVCNVCTVLLADI